MSLHSLNIKGHALSFFIHSVRGHREGSGWGSRGRHGEDREAGTQVLSEIPPDGLDLLADLGADGEAYLHKL